jgi:hypothetical protein
MVDQALGKPAERVEAKQSDSLDELSKLSTSELLALRARALADAASQAG